MLRAHHLETILSLDVYLNSFDDIKQKNNKKFNKLLGYSQLKDNN